MSVVFDDVPEFHDGVFNFVNFEEAQNKEAQNITSYLKKLSLFTPGNRTYTNGWSVCHLRF